MNAELGAMPPWPFTIGRVLKDTFRILRSNLGISAIVVVAYIVLWHLIVWLADDQPSDGFSWWNFTIRELWTVFLGGFFTTILVYGALVTLGGNRASLRDMARSQSFAVAVTAVYFLVEFPTLCSALPWATDQDPDRGLVPQIAIAFASYILYVLWFAAAPAVIAEGLGPLAALKRSVALTAGKRWPMCGLVFVISLTFGGLQWAAMIVGNALNAELGHTGSNLVFWMADYLLPAVALVFWAIAQTVAYAAIRLEKEGASALELARVFD